jgi:hypothetical protein
VRSSWGDSFLSEFQSRSLAPGCPLRPPGRHWFKPALTLRWKVKSGSYGLSLSLMASGSVIDFVGELNK